MENRLIPLLILLLLIATCIPGCGEKVPAQIPEETIAPTVLITTPPETPAPTDTAPPIPSATPEPFPDALSLGTSYRYGREDIAMEVTVYRAKVMDEYDWWSPKWGKYWNTTPKAGNRFLFAFVRLVDRGTIRARLPSSSMFVLHGDRSTYTEKLDRDESLWIRGIDVKQYDYYYNDRDGWIDPGESNQVEGFLLYEVPHGLSPDHAYLEITFTSKARAVWKLA